MLKGYWFVQERNAIWSTLNNAYVGEAPEPLSGTVQTEVELRSILVNLTNRHPITADDYAAAIEAHIDETAKAKAYGGTVSLASYVNSTIPQWKSEAETFVAWRDSVWAYAYLQMALAMSGQRTAPTLQEIVAELPKIVWPNAPSA